MWGSVRPHPAPMHPPSPGPFARSLSPLSALAMFVAFAPPALLSAEPAPASAAEGEGWVLVSRSEKLTVFKRPRKDSNIQEVKAVGLIEATPIVIKRVLDDTAEYPKFMPYVTESRVISRDGDSIIGYQRVSPPLISDRDYTMRIRSETRRNATGGTCYCNRWEPANHLGPAEKSGVARVKINEGYWLLEPVNEARHTQATYSLHCDSGGSLPAAVVNAANRTAIPKIFDGIRKQAKLAKYSAEK